MKGPLRKGSLVILAVTLALGAAEFSARWNLLPPRTNVKRGKLPLPLEKWGIEVHPDLAHKYDRFLPLINLPGRTPDYSKRWTVHSDHPFRTPESHLSRHFVLPDNVELFSVVQEVDAHNRRPTVPAGKAGDDRSLLFLGCSFTYGMGVPFDQAFPSLVGELTGIRSYNAGRHNAGPNLLLRLMTQPDSEFLTGIEGRKVTVIYTYIDLHLYRAICPSRCYYENSRYGFANLPEYHLEGSKLVGGSLSFEQAHPFKAWFSRVLQESAFVENFKIQIPPVPMPSDIELFVRLMQEIRAELEKRFTVERFIVVNYPSDSLLTAHRLRPP